MRINSSSNVQCELRANQQMTIITRALFKLDGIARATSIIPCSYRHAVNHGSFPHFQQLIDDSAMQRKYTRIVNTLGLKYYLKDSKLRTKAFVVKTEGDDYLIDGDTIKTNESSLKTESFNSMHTHITSDLE